MGLFRKDKQDGSVQDQIPELREFREKAIECDLPEEVMDFVEKEIDKMSKMGPSSSEYMIAMNHLEFLLGLPWARTTEDNLDIQRAESILNSEHYGLQEVKDRILEHLAVRTLRNTRKSRILIVDDEKMTCNNLERALNKEGYNIHTAMSGEKALEILNACSFDIIMTDLKMDKIDGLQVLERAREKNPQTEVIIFTGYATVPTAVKAMQKGSSEFLSKPLNLEEVRRVIAQAVSRKTDRFEPQGPVLCFVGPPGTGKTSLGVSIARSLERRFIHISLAGVRDESQLRGHRRSYIGALSGRILQELRRVDAKNPVFVLDEIDKLGQEYKGDPAAALLEILDPEQNKRFIDHYLDVPFDLSKVMFICTANSTDPLPEPLLDRLEVIQLSGYTEEEKEKIAFNYLIPQEKYNAGLVENELEFTPEAVWTIIRGYTREAGLRNLQRQIASLCRKTARSVLQAGSQGKATLTVTPEKVEELLGPRKYYFEVAAAKDRIGVATGLAWTPFGGEIIFIEATAMPGSSKLILTGSLGQVLKESAQAALSFLRSNAAQFEIAEDFYAAHDIHIHVPGGSIPKDGPSTGLTIAVALLSLLTQRACKREVALSGEITLSGRILPVSGIREKLLAARASGVKTVIFPAKNEMDIKQLSDSVTKDLKIILVHEFEDIVGHVRV